MRKVYVDVIAEFKNGEILPCSFTWDDGHQYMIDYVLDIRPAASLKVGGIGLRYTVKVAGKQAFMWLDNSGMQWFMEGK
jgi:hypothetical protein